MKVEQLNIERQETTRLQVGQCTFWCTAPVIKKVLKISHKGCFLWIEDEDTMKFIIFARSSGYLQTFESVLEYLKAIEEYREQAKNLYSEAMSYVGFMGIMKTPQGLVDIKGIPV